MARVFSTSVRTLFVNFAISLAVALIVLFLTQDILFEFPPLKRAELSLVDLRFQQRGLIPGGTDSSRVVIVGISQESFKSISAPWPWPKSLYTHLIRNLHRAGARAIGLDVVFSSGDTHNTGDDEEFRNALRETRAVVLAGKLEPEHRQYRLLNGREDYGNVFTDATDRVGLVNIPTDADGVLRRYWPFIYDSASGRRIPTFSFSILNAYFGKEAGATAEIAGINFQYAGRQLPRFDSISFLINFSGPSGCFKTINFVDVIDDSTFATAEELQHPGLQVNTFDDSETGYLRDELFKGKIVLVGSIMPEDKDLFPVSIAEGRREGDNQMYGVEIHANVIQSVLENNFIIRQPRWMTALVIFGLSLFTFALTAGLKAIKTKYSAHIEILGVAIIMAEIVIIYWISMRLFIEGDFLTDMMSPFLTVIGCYVGSTVYNYVSERKQRVLIKGMFSQYVNPSVVDELVAHPEKLRLGGERRELTVFFSDIESFTRISEKMPPEELVAILNEYLSIMTSLIFLNDGTLDKYEGDAIVAFWGAPVPQPDHALRACRAAVQMQYSLEGLRRLWIEEGKPLFNTRIGINTGEVIVGNMGGANRFDYTVIGDSVNLGSRLEGANKQYHTNILISEGTYNIVAGQVHARELDMILVAGKTEPIRVFELVGVIGDGEVPESVLRCHELYSKGLASYRQRAWSNAISLFEQVLQVNPMDYPSRMYLERSEVYRATPPPEDWNGVFVMTSK